MAQYLPKLKEMYKMRSLFTIIFLGFIVAVKAQPVPQVKADDLVRRIQNGQDTSYVINFWATWCAPCVKELPYFEEINAEYSGQKVKVILVSLDLKKDADARLKAFIERRGLKSEVLYLDERDPNVWIPKFTDQWEGVIPATLLYNASKGTKVFRAGSFEGNELKDFLKENGFIRD